MQDLVLYGVMELNEVSRTRCTRRSGYPMDLTSEKGFLLVLVYQ